MRTIILAMGVLCLLAACTFRYEYSSDGEVKSSEKRYDLDIYFDHGTGCHYVRGWSGGLYPRMNREGKQVCDEVKQ